MHSSGDLNLSIVERQAEYFLSRGVSGVFIAGTTGECHSLRVEERLALTERWAQVAAGSDLQLYIHVGHNCQRDAQTLAEHASKLPVDAIAAMAPCYFKPQSIPQLLEFLAPIAASALRLPFYYYDIPSLTGVHLSMLELLHQGPMQIANLAGIKYTNADFAQFEDCVLYDGEAFNIMFGCDECLVDGLARGAASAVGSTYNFAAPLYNMIIDEYDAGNVEAASVLQDQSKQMVEVLSEYGFSAAAKSVMKMIGIDCGPARSPLNNLTTQQLDELEQRLTELSLLG